MKRKQKANHFTCSACGTSNTVMTADAPGRTAPWINYTPRSIDREEIDAVVIPLKHALHISIPATFVAAVVFVLPDPSLSFEQRALAGATIVGLGTFIVVRTVAAVKNWEHLGWKLEQMFNIDLNRDRVVGEPVAQAEVHNVVTSMTVEERAINGNIERIKTLDWPCKPAEIEAIARRLLDGYRTDTDWGKGKLLPIRKYKKLRGSLIENGYAHWIDPDNHPLGWDLTVAGRRLLTLPPTPPAQV